ncbi:MAG: acyl-CoA synthetase [Myxococcota bacterium]
MKATGNWLEMHARFRPHAEALHDVGTGRRWTYAALHHESLRWAGRLARAGVVAGDRVAVLAHNRGETLAILFACAELGACLLPMNWRLADPELRWQLDHCTPRVVLADGENLGRLGGLALDEGCGDHAIEGPGATLEAPWVLMYTSGSTGKPKGAILTHRQVHWNAINTVLACDLAPGDATLTFTPLFHTGGLNCLTTPLLHRGGRVVLTRGFEPAESLRLIQEERVSLLMGVPTIFQMMSDHPAFDATDLSSVRDALVGGAAIPLPLLHRWRARRIPLRQGFGLTEVGPNCFSLPPHRVDDKPGSVGLPIHHVAAKLVRPDGSECRADEPGELLLGGPAVCGGYWNDPAATAACIRDGWFHTGDVLSRDADGFFYVRGRIKEMYKSGGENVYPPEVEAVLHACPGVALAAVIGVPDVRWGEVGRAFVEPAPGAAVTPDAVRTFLDGKLARFKLPKSVHVLAALPRTASGKVDRQALRALEVP